MMMRIILIIAKDYLTTKRMATKKRTMALNHVIMKRYPNIIAPAHRQILSVQLQMSSKALKILYARPKKVSSMTVYHLVLWRKS